MSEKGGIISFRMSAADRAMLERLASTEGISVGEIARQIVTERIHNKESMRAIQVTNEAILDELKQLREAVALSAEAVLSNQGKMLSRDEVRGWVERNLRS